MLHVVGYWYYSLRQKILFLKIDIINVFITKISLDSLIFRTIIFEQREYYIPRIYSVLH